MDHLLPKSLQKVLEMKQTVDVMSSLGKTSLLPQTDPWLKELDRINRIMRGPRDLLSELLERQEQIRSILSFGDLDGRLNCHLQAMDFRESIGFYFEQQNFLKKFVPSLPDNFIPTIRASGTLCGNSVLPFPWFPNTQPISCPEVGGEDTFDFSLDVMRDHEIKQSILEALNETPSNSRILLTPEQKQKLLQIVYSRVNIIAILMCAHIMINGLSLFPQTGILAQFLDTYKLYDVTIDTIFYFYIRSKVLFSKSEHPNA